MDNQSFDILKELVETPSPSGFEQAAAAVWRREAARVADMVSGDVLGNAIAVRNPDGRPRVMLAGHLDEIGFMVRYIDEQGYLYFAPIGGHDNTVAVGQRVVIHNEKGPVYGVVGRMPWHLLDEEDREKKLELHDLWIDIGAETTGEALSRVDIGDPVTFDAGVRRLTDRIVASRAFDDKMGAFILLETLRLLRGKPIRASLCAVATTQEEVGYRGATVSSYALDPQIGIAIDVGHATDYPDAGKKHLGEFKLGRGPMVHRGPNVNPKVERLLLRVAKEQGIPVQVAARPWVVGTDCTAIQMARAGLATAVVSVPLRYMHTPNETLSLDDLESTAKLLAAFVETLDPSMDWTP